ncbi:MAG: response regulator transcription factor [Alphaproteobacteria bacterium]|nr:response regulator transcription factor [Alphaproteobacteria bacterium]
MTFLIADEQPLCREGLISILAQSYSDPVVAQADNFVDVSTALAGGTAIKMLILDLALPGVNGVAGIRQLRAQHPEVRIIVMCSRLRRSLVLDYLAAGVHGCIARSCSSAEMAEAIEVVDRGRIFVPEISSDGGADKFRKPAAEVLSQRQKEVLAILATGKSNKEIARKLRISEGTVKVHLNAIFRSLGVHNRVGAVTALKAIDHDQVRSESNLRDLLNPYLQAGDKRRDI